MDYTFPTPAFKDAVVPTDDQTPIERAVEHYFQQYSPATVRAYKTDLQCWWNFCHKNVHDSDEHDVLRFIKHLEEDGYQNSSINRKLAALSKVFSIYVSIGIAKKNPVQMLATTTRVYKSVDSQAYVTVSKHDIEAVLTGARRGTAVIEKFLANTGLRISELTGITKNDLEAFNTEFMRILIVGKGKKIRMVFIPYTLYQEVKGIFDTTSDYLFASKNGKPLSRVNIYKQIQNAFVKYAGRPGVRCHALRHFFATEKIVSEKKDYKAVSKYLGHSSVATTLNLYTHSQLRPEDTQII